MNIVRGDENKLSLHGITVQYRDSPREVENLIMALGISALSYWQPPPAMKDAIAQAA